MYIPHEKSILLEWDKVKAWNYKLSKLQQKKSVVYVEIMGEHGEVRTGEIERIYYIIDGEGEFLIDGKKQIVKKNDVITVPPHILYNYFSNSVNPLKIILFMELWDN